MQDTVGKAGARLTPQPACPGILCAPVSLLRGVCRVPSMSQACANPRKHQSEREGTFAALPEFLVQVGG